MDGAARSKELHDAVKGAMADAHLGIEVTEEGRAAAAAAAAGEVAV